MGFLRDVSQGKGFGRENCANGSVASYDNSSVLLFSF